jgi:hypothetical protein
MHLVQHLLMSHGEQYQRRSHFAHEDTEHGDEVGSRIRGRRAVKAIIYSKQSRKTYSFTSNLKGTRLSDLEGSVTFLDPAEASAHVRCGQTQPYNYFVTADAQISILGPV